MSRISWCGLVVVVAAAAGCGKAPDATGDWQCDGEWLAQRVARAVRENDRQVRAVVPEMPPMPKDATQPSADLARVFSQFRLTLRPDGTCTVQMPLAGDEHGTWTQSGWRVRFTNAAGDTDEFRLLDAETGEMRTSNDEPLRFKRVR